MKFVIIQVVCIAVLICIVSIFLPGNQIHYKGKTVLTAEQYVDVVKGANVIPTEDNFLTESENGDLVFTYDFYSTESYTFLVNRGLESKFTRMLNTVGGSLYEGRFAIGAWFGLIIGVLIFVKVRKLSQHKIISFVRRIIAQLEKWNDRRCKDVPFAQIKTAPTLNLIYNAQGILSIRSWSVNRHGDLKSIVQGTKWDSKEFMADKNPGKDDDSGIYAYRLGSNIKQQSTVMGIVELDGKYEYHPDGIIRAEHCKILCLFISKSYQKLGRLLSNKYAVPLFFDDTPEIAYLHWLYSEVGQKSLQHNYELLKGG